MNYAEELTRMPDPPKDVPSSRDYAKEIMDDAVKRDFVDTGAISTITTQPEKKLPEKAVLVQVSFLMSKLDM